MKQRRLANAWRAALLAALLAVCADAVADWQSSAGLRVGGFWIEEQDRDGSTLVDEQGLLGGVTVDLDRVSPRWIAGLSGTLEGGTADYDGQTQGGSPLQTTTDYRAWRLAGRLGWQLDRGPLRALYGLAGRQQRQLEINGTDLAGGLEETFRTTWLGLGSEWRLAPTATLRAELACAVDSRVDVRFDALFDNASVDVDDHCRLSLRARWRARPWRGGRIFVEPYLDYERLPRSNPTALTRDGIPIGSVVLPETTLLWLGVTIGFESGSGR